MKKSIEVYHRSGKKVIITNVPVNNDECDSFEIMLSLQKQIDEIDYVADPKSEYHFNG
ncbi:hypothetical protein ACJ2A9_12110 [Anaerobacillus sp. MEB173]|uniref:hypothetical protein n=1 Tax=Anaerobacillus sp. MEB173 TaxID=3383345 RepID=UPI003F8DD338